jgi:hypothetical protein
MGAAGGQKEAASAANHSQSRFSIRTGGQTRAEQVIVRGALMMKPLCCCSKDASVHLVHKMAESLFGVVLIELAR